MLSKTRKILAVCLVVAVISTIVGVVSALLNPEAISMFTAASPGIIAVVLCIALISSKKDNGK